MESEANALETGFEVDFSSANKTVSYWECVKHTLRVVELMKTVEADSSTQLLLDSVVYNTRNEIDQHETHVSLTSMTILLPKEQLNSFILKTRDLLLHLYYGGCKAIDRQWWIDTGQLVRDLTLILLFIQVKQENDFEMTLKIWQWTCTMMKSNLYLSGHKRKRELKIPSELSILLDAGQKATED